MPKNDLAEAYELRAVFLGGGGTHERFAIEYPDYAWLIACDVMSKAELTADAIADLRKPLPPGPDDYNLEDLDDDGKRIR